MLPAVASIRMTKMKMQLIRIRNAITATRAVKRLIAIATITSVDSTANPVLERSCRIPRLLSVANHNADHLHANQGVRRSADRVRNRIPTGNPAAAVEVVSPSHHVANRNPPVANRNPPVANRNHPVANRNHLAVRRNLVVNRNLAVNPAARQSRAHVVTRALAPSDSN